MVDEVALIAGCRANDRSAQHMLYRRYADAMYTIAFRITRNKDLASDVLQEAFIRVFRYISDFRQESTLGAWIRTIVVRTAISLIRREQKGFSYDLSEVMDLGITPGYKDTDYLEKAILSLPSGYRTVFLLVEVEGYSHQDVSDLLGISIGTSKSQLFYAKRRLRLLLSAVF